MTEKLTLKVTKLAYYKNGLVYPNEIIKNYIGSIPSWATLANGKELKQEENNPTTSNLINPTDNQNETSQNENSNTEETNEEEKNEEVIAADGGEVHVAKEEKTEVELLAELEKLLNEGIEKNIIIEDADKKTVTEQVAEMKKLLGKE